MRNTCSVKSISQSNHFISPQGAITEARRGHGALEQESGLGAVFNLVLLRALTTPSLFMMMAGLSEEILPLARCCCPSQI